VRASLQQDRKSLQRRASWATVYAHFCGLIDPVDRTSDRPHPVPEGEHREGGDDPWPSPGAEVHEVAGQHEQRPGGGDDRPRQQELEALVLLPADAVHGGGHQDTAPQRETSRAWLTEEVGRLQSFTFHVLQRIGSQMHPVSCCEDWDNLALDQVMEKDTIMEVSTGSAECF
jgi:hypothetical protein